MNSKTSRQDYFIQLDAITQKNYFCMDWLKPNNDTESVDVQFENNGKWIAGDRNKRTLETIKY